MSNQDNAQSQIELEQHLQFQSLLAELSANFVRVPTDMIDQEIKESLRRIAENLDLDSIALGLITADGQDFYSGYRYAKPGKKLWLADSLMSEGPFLTRTLLAGKPFIMHDVEALPNEVVTRPAPPAAQITAPQAETEPANAEDILKRMAEFLAKTPQFSVNLSDSFDVVQESGQKIEFGESRKIIVSRPNGLRVDLEESSGEKHTVQYDGKDITISSPTENVYAQVAKPGGIDEAVKYFLKDLHMRLPLAALLISRFPAEVESRTQSLDYVEKTVIDGTSTHHLAGRTETVDYQVWIADGAQPLPLRIVLTYKNAEGMPEFRAQFSDWNLAPKIQDSQFAFTPPEGARKIVFQAQLSNFAPAGTESPEQTGGQK